MDNSELRDRLKRIVDDRAKRLPRVTGRLDRLDDLDEALESLRQSARNLPPDWAEQPEVRDALARIDDSEIGKNLGEARVLLGSVKARLSRNTVNVGVSGRARVGKSTLLQSVSGLTDNQVPTGDDINVTAVRSRIFHASAPRALLTFHSRSSFLEEVVWPYFTELEVVPAPTSIDAFTDLDLVAEMESRRATTDGGLTVHVESLWSRLIQIQEAVPSIKQHLDQGELTLTDLDKLRPYVAYPTKEQDKAEVERREVAPRDYLAVRDCRIESPFPETAVDRLGIVDLPGLGEVASGIDDKILTGLRDEVDVVLLMKRAAVGLTPVDDTDVKAADLIGRARGDIADTRDFAWIVINASKGDESRVEAMRGQILTRLNFGKADSRYLTLQADARDAADVHQAVLVPVLDRLTERLPAMDQQVLEGAMRSVRAPLLAIQAAATSLREAVSRARTSSGSPREELNDLAYEMRADLQQSLGRLRPERLGDEYVDRYIERVDAVHAEVKEWLKDGLGSFENRADWIEHAVRESGTELSLRPFAIAELHRLRVEVTSRYAQLDEYLNDVLVEEFYGTVCEAFEGTESDGAGKSGAHLGSLLGPADRSPAARIQTLLANFQACDPPVPGLVAAVERLAGIRFDFRLQSYPVLHDLSLERRPKDGVFPPDFETVDLMYDWFSEVIVQYSHNVRQALAEDANRQFKVLSGAAVVFEDEIIRSGRSKRELRNLADGFRDELWPGRFSDANSKSARARVFADSVTAVQRAVADALGENDE